MISIDTATEQYLVSLRRANASPTTIETYRIALAGLGTFAGAGADQRHDQPVKPA